MADILQTKFSRDSSKIEVAYRTGETKFVNGHKKQRQFIFRINHIDNKFKIFKMKRDSLKEVPYILYHRRSDGKGHEA